MIYPTIFIHDFLYFLNHESSSKDVGILFFYPDSHLQLKQPITVRTGREAAGHVIITIQEYLEEMEYRHWNNSVSP
jgi:hypothetical protein